ncbi:hypothetical protein [Streptomyces sp. NPDC058463]|uniref:hypothetical protein n=1 Tax=Streptomyces sp. NPDC058463 TaxID=3346510 RepID=UPI00364E7807
MLGTLKLKLLGTATAAGILAIGIAASPAQAQGTTWCDNLEIGGEVAARGCFSEYGDHVYAGDYRADGWRAVTEWKTNYGRTGECHDDRGATDTLVDCNYDMAESGSITFRIVVRNGADGTNQYQTGWHKYVPIGG